MREIKIAVDPFDFISILGFECTKELNEHGIIEIKGIIAQENVKKYQEMAAREIWVIVKLIGEDGTEKVFFHGILTNLFITTENLVSVLSFTAKTGSYMLDIVRHDRSYQRESFTYEQVLKDCLEPDSGKYIMPDGQTDRVNRFLVQYKETDWEFVKRLAGYAGTVVIPEFAVPGGKLYFGYRKNTKQETMITDSYRIIQDGEAYQRRKCQSANPMTNSDRFAYEVQSREVHELGETVIFQERELVIGKITSRLSGQELVHTYVLHTKAMGRQPQENNRRLAGISLKANVLNIDKTRVMISIQGDENRNHSGNRWFDFATVYSTPDGTGWYCMPEIGDEVRVAFPDSDENNAYVVSCIHLENGDRENPDEKSWKNKQRKEILFTPNSLILRNNKGMSIEIADEEGIKVVSDKKIILQAEQEINVRSGAGVQLSAEDSMLLSQGGASIQMSDAINISGGKIYMN